MKDLFKTILLGTLAGLLVAAFYQTLQFAQNLRTQWSFLIYFLPVALVLVEQLRQQTLYFPYKVSELKEMLQDSPFYWNRFMTFYHYIGTSLGHVVGASLGREGTVVIMTTGLVEFFKWNTRYWGAIAAAIGFSAATGNKWAGLFFIAEVFTTTIQQKIFTFLGSWFAIMVMESAQVPHLLPEFSVQPAYSIWQRFFFILIAGIIFGFVSRIYKEVYFYLSGYLKKKKIFFRLLCAVIVMGLLQPSAFHIYQGLSLQHLPTLLQGGGSVEFTVIKLIITLCCLSLGFMGGEYVPLVVSGLSLGAVVASLFGEPMALGMVLGAFGLFCGGTKLKWTSVLLCLSLCQLNTLDSGFFALFTGQWGLFFWVYFFYSVTNQFSGELTLYFRQPHPFFSKL